MSRLCSAAIALLLCAVLVRAEDTQSEDALEGWLQSRGLHGLVALQLEQRLESATDRNREELAERLAMVYAQLLEAAQDNDSRRELIERGQALLDSVDAADTVELRLGLTRAAYEGVESSAERIRLRLPDAEPAEELARHLTDLEEQFARIAQLADQRVRALEKQEESGNAQIGDDLLSRSLARARRNRSLAHYYGGWACVYIAELREDQRESRAGDALRHFGWLLNAQRGQRPELERIPDSLFAYDHVARAALGCALAYAMLQQSETASEWLDRIEQSEDLAASVAGSLGVFRMLAMAYADAWMQAEAALRAYRGSDVLAPLEARLAAVLALDSRGDRRAERAATDQITRIAIADLVANSATSHIVELASMYDLSVEGGSGFIPKYVRALRLYTSGQDRMKVIGAGSGEPVQDAEARRLFLEAGIGFADAHDEPDAAAFEMALAHVAVLRGLSLYFAADASNTLVEAARWLERGASGIDATDPGRAREARWVAIRALEIALQRGGGEAVRTDHGRAIDAFVRAYPDDPRAALARFERATDPRLSREQAVGLLLAVESESAVYEAARHRAAAMLYDSYKASAPDRRAWAARRFADIAEPLLYRDLRQSDPTDQAVARRALGLALRIAEVVLSTTELEVERAIGALDAIALIEARAVFDTAPFRQEVLYRRAQVDLRRGDIQAAEQIIDQMNPESRRTVGARLLFANAVASFRSEQGEGRVEWGERVVAYGRRVIADLLDQGGDATGGVLVGVQSDVAEAAELLWTETGEREMLELARRLAEVLLNADPSDRATLTMAARLEEAAGESRAALEHWRVLAAGLPSGTEAWFEARYHVIINLEQVDRSAAVESIEQLMQLYPSLGEEPWRSELMELAGRLLVSGSRDG